MRLARLAILTLLALALAVLCLGDVSAEAPYEFTFDLQCYRSTTLTFNFPATDNASISDIHTVGRSVYKYEGSASYLAFIAQGVDIYTFAVHLHYENATSGNMSRTIIVGVQSGNTPMDSYSVSSSASDFAFYVKLTLTEQPTYPTPEEVSEAVTHKIEEKLVTQEESVRSLMDSVSTMQYISLVTTALVTTVSLSVAVVVVVMWHRWRGPSA